MTRYLAVSTALVVFAVAIALAIAKHGLGFDLRGGDHAPAGATPSPARSALATVVSDSPPPFRGDASWALSALPDCYRELSMRRDDLPAVERAAPPVAAAIARGSSLTSGTCRIEVGAGRLTVRRADDVFQVRDVARFYVAHDASYGDTLVLLRRGDGLPEIRRYRFRVATSLVEPGRGPLRLESKT